MSTKKHVESYLPIILYTVHTYSPTAYEPIVYLMSIGYECLLLPFVVFVPLSLLSNRVYPKQLLQPAPCDFYIPPARGSISTPS